MRLLIKVLPLPTGPANSLYRHVRITQRDPVMFSLPVKPDMTFGQLWPLIEERYKKNYLTPKEADSFIIKKLQDIYGSDLDVDDTISATFEGVTDQEKLMVQVVQSRFDREVSIPPTSNLRPSIVHKRHLDVYHNEVNKRRRVEEPQPDHADEDLDRDRPVRSVEATVEPHDREGGRTEDGHVTNESHAHNGHLDPEVIIVEDSQREGNVADDAEMDDLAKSESLEPQQKSRLEDIPVSASVSRGSPVLGEEVNFSEPSESIFKVPTLPASVTRPRIETPTRGDAAPEAQDVQETPAQAPKYVVVGQRSPDDKPTDTYEFVGSDAEDSNGSTWKKTKRTSGLKPVNRQKDSAESSEDHLDQNKLNRSSAKPNRWSPEEDKALVAARARGLAWTAIASQYLPQRTAEGCKKRYTRVVQDTDQPITGQSPSLRTPHSALKGKSLSTQPQTSNRTPTGDRGHSASRTQQRIRAIESRRKEAEKSKYFMQKEANDAQAKAAEIRLRAQEQAELRRSREASTQERSTQERDERTAGDNAVSSRNRVPSRLIARHTESSPLNRMHGDQTKRSSNQAVRKLSSSSPGTDISLRRQSPRLSSEVQTKSLTPRDDVQPRHDRQPSDNGGVQSTTLLTADDDPHIASNRTSAGTASPEISRSAAQVLSQSPLRRTLVEDEEDSDVVTESETSEEGDTDSPSEADPDFGADPKRTEDAVAEEGPKTGPRLEDNLGSESGTDSESDAESESDVGPEDDARLQMAARENDGSDSEDDADPESDAELGNAGGTTNEGRRKDEIVVDSDTGSESNASLEDDNAVEGEDASSEAPGSSPPEPVKTQAPRSDEVTSRSLSHVATPQAEHNAPKVASEKQRPAFVQATSSTWKWDLSALKRPNNSTPQSAQKAPAPTLNAGSSSSSEDEDEEEDESNESSASDDTSDNAKSKKSTSNRYSAFRKGTAKIERPTGPAWMRGLGKR